MIWFACAALVMAAAIYTLNPLFRESKDEPSLEIPDEMELDRLLERKAVIYRSIKDLEFEHAMGRLTEADFRRLQADYKNDAALLLQRLDQLGASEKLEETIEKDVAARKASLVAPQMDRKTLRCPSCGAETVPGKKFCADCGQQL
jgi:hypothetical protein